MIEIDIKKFDQLKKQSARSYNDQKAIIKKVMAGKQINCKSCQQVLFFSPPQAEQKAMIHCSKGCTSIELDIDV